MCGRYQFTEPQNADLRRILQDVRRRCGDRAQDFRFGDVMPTAAAPVLIANGGKVVADLQDPTGAYPETTAITETRDRLYVQSLHAHGLGWLPKQ